MRVQSDTELVSFEDWHLRVRPATRAPARLLVLAHGWTGDEDSMWVFVRDFGPDYWIVAPRAPFAAEPGGFSWRPPRPGPHDRPTFKDLEPAVDLLMSLVDKYAAACSLDSTQFSVMGFSQGAALVNVLALLHARRLDRIGILAGFVPGGAELLAARHPLKGKPVFIAHGTLDETINIEDARRSVKFLEQAGANVTVCEDEVGHKLSARCLRALDQFFA